MDTIQLRVGAGWFDSFAGDSAARDSRVASSPTTRRETAAAGGRRHPAGLLHSGFRSRYTPPSPFPICSSSPLSSPHFSHRLNPFIFLLDLRGTEQAARAAAAGRSFPPASILVGRPRRPPSPTTSATVGASSVERCASSVCNFSGRLFEKLDDVLARLLSLFKIDCVPSIFMTTNREFPSRCLSIVSGNQQ